MRLALTSRTSRSVFVAIATTTALGVASAPAGASDTSFRKVVASQERTVKPVAAAFPDATLDVASAVGRERAVSASDDLTSALRRLRKATAKQQATTARLRSARKQYLRAAQDALDGLAAFDRGIAAFDPAAPSKGVSALKAARARIAAAFAKRAHETRTIGVARKA